MSQKLSILALGLLLLFGAGCASGAKSSGMTARNYPPVSTVRESLVVTVAGGEETNPMWASKISDPDFRTAALESLRRSGLFRQVNLNGASDYRLELTMENLEQPLAGFNMTVALRVEWRLVRLPDGNVLWRDLIQTVYTEKFSGAFSGVKRLRLANEGAARENLEEGLKRLAALK